MSSAEHLEKLYQQLADVEKQQIEVNGRLRDLAPQNLRRLGPGQGRGAPFPRRDNAVGGRGSGAPGRGYSFQRESRTSSFDQRAAQPSFGDLAERRGPPRQARSWISWEGNAPRSERERPEKEPEAEKVPVGPRRLSSAIVVDGEAVAPADDEMEDERPAASGRWGDDWAEEGGEMDGGYEAPVKGIGKRPVPPSFEEKPDVKRRNQRMFGALLGTLQQFRKEDDKFRQSSVATKRQEALKKAEAKAEAAARELRTKERERLTAKRQAELRKKRELMLRAEKMRTEINFHRRVDHRRRLNKFIFTKAEPALLWLPKVHSEATEKALADQEAGLEEWIQGEKSKMEATHAELDSQLAEIEAANKEAAAKAEDPSGAQANGGAKHASKDPAGDPADGDEVEEGELPQGEGSDQAGGGEQGEDEDQHKAEEDEADEEMADEEPNPEGLADLLS